MTSSYFSAKAMSLEVRVSIRESKIGNTNKIGRIMIGLGAASISVS